MFRASYGILLIALPKPSKVLAPLGGRLHQPPHSVRRAVRYCENSIEGHRFRGPRRRSHTECGAGDLLARDARLLRDPRR
jgi:hypothetical protein